MTDWNHLILNGLIYGLLLSLLLTVLMTIAGAVALDMFVDNFPREIRQRYGPMSPRAARLRPYVVTVLFSPILIVPTVGLFRLRTELGSVGFLSALTFSGVTLFVFNLYDLLILDWLFFCTIQPRSMVLPGTEGMAAYRDYRFHFIGFLKGLGFTAVGGLVVALVWTVIQWLVSSRP